MADDGDIPAGFVSLDNYEPPSLDSAGLLVRAGRDLVHRVRGPRHENVSFTDLVPLSDADIDAVATNPAYGQLKTQLDLALANWVSSTPKDTRTQLIVYPPTDEARFLTDWAADRGIAVIDEVNGGRQRGAFTATMEAVQEEGLVMIPALQHYFLREVGGLDAVRTLLISVCQSRQPVILGCSSWAWQYLIKAVHAQHLLPKALVPQAFSAERLKAWLEPMARASGLTFHSVLTGGDVFLERNMPTAFHRLAVLSGGVPWVAWDIWRRSLYRRESDQNGIVWVVLPKPPSLPDDDERESLLILHALLVHGGLTSEELPRVVPLSSGGTVVAMLQRRGFVETRDGKMEITRRSYPAIRTALTTAGYPGDGL